MGVRRRASKAFALDQGDRPSGAPSPRADAGPHPHPRKAQEGQRLRVLAVDEFAASVVQRIFDLYLQGWGNKAIAELLNREGIPCPSAHTPRQNRHRKMDGWQHSSVVAILDNPRYTGYAVYGRWQKVEELLDPEDVAAGYVVRFRRSPRAKIVRSREPAHPAIVSVETFTAVQLEQRRRRLGGRAGWSSLERKHQSRKRVYAFRSRITCVLCERKMEGATRRKDTTYYRCNVRTLVPGSATALAHPPQVYLREDLVTPAVNRWIGQLFDPMNRDETVTTLLSADDSGDQHLKHVSVQRNRIAAADVAMERLRRALDAGWDPAELRDQYNAAAAEKRSAEKALAATQHDQAMSREELESHIRRLGDMAEALARADRVQLTELYAALRLSLRYDHINKTVDVEVDPMANRVAKLRVRGRTRTLTTRLALQEDAPGVMAAPGL